MSHTTTDLSDFGYRELAMAGKLLTAYAHERKGPEDFEPDGVTVMMNTSSGNVFLTNSEHQVAMMNGDKLESFYTCPECGHEGFKDEMQHEGDAECARYLREIGVTSEDEDDEDIEESDELREARESLETAESEENGRCDSCEASIVNGVRCHEHSCPRYARLKRLRETVALLEDY